MKAAEEVVRKSLGTEDEPFEGQVPIEKVEEEVQNLRLKILSYQGGKTHKDYLFLEEMLTHGRIRIRPASDFKRSEMNKARADDEIVRRFSLSLCKSKHA